MGKAEKSQYTGNVQVCVGVGECRPEFMAKSTKYYYFVVSLHFSLSDLLLFKHPKLKVKICHFLGTGSSGEKKKGFILVHCVCFIFGKEALGLHMPTSVC